MIYQKPKDVTYTEMAIYIDEHAYSPDCTEEIDSIIYEYLYHLIRMLAKKANYFNRTDYYDDFAIEGATRVFLRLRNKKQFEKDEDGNLLMTPIKSVLNYIKSLMFPMRREFERNHYFQQGPQKEIEEDQEIISEFNELLIRSTNDLRISDFNTYLLDISKTCKGYLKNIPYYQKDMTTWINIYFSCMLSFLNSITINNRDKERISIDNNRCEKNIDKLLDKERENFTILFHLPINMKDYITVLTNNLKFIMADDLSNILKTDIGCEDNIAQIALSDIFENNQGELNEI